MVTINPKSLTLGELYGEFEANTAEWTDGILSSTVRNFIKNNDEISEEKGDDETESNEGVIFFIVLLFHVMCRQSETRFRRFICTEP